MDENLCCLKNKGKKKNYADNNSTTPWQRSTAKVENVLPK